VSFFIDHFLIDFCLLTCILTMNYGGKGQYAVALLEMWMGLGDEEWGEAKVLWTV